MFHRTLQNILQNIEVHILWNEIFSLARKTIQILTLNTTRFHKNRLQNYILVLFKARFQYFHNDFQGQEQFSRLWQ